MGARRGVLPSRGRQLARTRAAWPGSLAPRRGWEALNALAHGWRRVGVGWGLFLSGLAPRRGPGGLFGWREREREL